MGLVRSLRRWLVWLFRRFVSCDLCYELGVIHFGDGDAIRCYCGRPCFVCGGSRVKTDEVGNHKKCPWCFKIPVRHP